MVLCQESVLHATRSLQMFNCTYAIATQCALHHWILQPSPPLLRKNEVVDWLTLSSLEKFQRGHLTVEIR